MWSGDTGYVGIHGGMERTYGRTFARSYVRTVVRSYGHQNQNFSHLWVTIFS